MNLDRGADRTDLYQAVSEKLIAQIEGAAGIFQMPWYHDGSPTARPTNAESGLPYRGINVFALWVAAQAAYHPTGLWATYRQWKSLGAQVRKGEHGNLVVFWKKLGTPENDGDGEVGETDQPPRRFVARGYRVFNAAQVDGYVPQNVPVQRPERERIARAEFFYRNLNIDTRFGGDEAYYMPSGDYVQVPPYHQFRDDIGFYAVLLHEGAHASGAPHRLNRDLSGRFGSEAYAMEEMIADWAACLACMTLELAPEPRPDHAQYINSWLNVLKRDKRAMFTAAREAQRIADWMWEQQISEASQTIVAS
jgi:antirestriction protein ArdC